MCFIHISISVPGAVISSCAKMVYQSVSILCFKYQGRNRLDVCKDQYKDCDNRWFVMTMLQKCFEKM